MSKKVYIDKSVLIGNNLENVRAESSSYPPDFFTYQYTTSTDNTGEIERVSFELTESRILIR